MLAPYLLIDLIMRNTLILIAVSLHIIALLWSCYQPKEIIEGVRFTVAEILEKEDGKLEINWNAEPPQEWAEVYIKDSEENLEEKLLLRTTTNKITVQNPSQSKTTYFRLVTAEVDTLLIFEP